MSLEKKRRAVGRGRTGERLAAWLLIFKGYRILERGWRAPVGEIDLIARRGGTLVFVEVKARPELDEAQAAVHPAQQARIVRAAAAFVQSRPALARCVRRFDLIAVAPGRLPRHLADAWRPEPD